MVPPPAKPIAIWIAQAFMLLVSGGGLVGFSRAIASGYFSISGGAVVIALVACAAGLVVGMQLRLGWARWGTASFIAIAFLLLVYQSLERSGGAGSAEQAGDLTGSLISNLLFLLLAWRVALGEPSRAYFAGKPVAPVRSFEES